MQALFKKYFFLVNLLFIALSAYLLARAGNIFVGHFLSPAVPEVAVQAPTRPKPRSGKSEKRTFDSATERNIFAAKREQLVPVEASELQEEEQEEIDLEAEAVATSLNIKLVATSVFIPAEWSLATIEDLSAKDTGIYSINACRAGNRAAPAPSDDDDEAEAEEGTRRTALRNEPPKGAVRSIKLPTPCNRLLDTATILSIEVDRVVFLNEESGRKEFIDFYAEPKKGVKVAKATPKRAKKDKGGPSGKGIKKISANSFEIEQGEIDATLSNLNSIATQARIVPSFKDGQANGFKLFSIRPGSLYSKIGIKNGDVIQRINGYEITSPDKALEIYSKLKDSKSITVDLQRRGKPQTLDYRIVP